MPDDEGYLPGAQVLVRHEGFVIGRESLRGSVAFWHGYVEVFQLLRSARWDTVNGAGEESRVDEPEGVFFGEHYLLLGAGLGGVVFQAVEALLNGGFDVALLVCCPLV